MDEIHLIGMPFGSVASNTARYLVDDTTIRASISTTNIVYGCGDSDFNLRSVDLADGVAFTRNDQGAECSVESEAVRPLARLKTGLRPRSRTPFRFGDFTDSMEDRPTLRDGLRACRGAQGRALRAQLRYPKEDS